MQRQGHGERRRPIFDISFILSCLCLLLFKNTPKQMIGLPGKYRVSTAVPQGRGGGEQRIDQTHSGWGCNLYVRQAMSLNKFLQRENRGV